MFIWGGLAILAAFGLFGVGEIIPAFFWAAVGSGLIAYGIHRNKQRQQQAQQQTVIVNNYTTPPPAPQPDPQPQPSGMVVRATSSVVTGKTFAVAGVTFKNDDGSSRQEILRDLCEGPLEGEADCWFEPFLYKGEMALRVKVGSDCVGNVRRSDVQTVLDCLKTSPDGAHLQAEIFENDEGEEIYRADFTFDGVTA